MSASHPINGFVEVKVRRFGTAVTISHEETAVALLGKNGLGGGGLLSPHTSFFRSEAEASTAIAEG